MPSITVRNVPEATRDELAARAARSGHSLQEYLRSELIELGARPDPGALAERITQRKQHTTSKLDAEKILAYRDENRR